MSIRGIRTRLDLGRAWVGLLLLPFAGACDDDRRPTADVEGLWVLAADTAPAVHIRIGADSISVWREEPLADCFERIDYEIRDVDGTRFRITAREPDDAFSITLRRDDEDLIVDAFGEETRYEPSTLDPETLLLCQPTDPGVACGTLSVLTLGDTIDGSLEASDDENADGSHYDLFAVHPTTAGEIRIEMESSEIDSYLVLYDSAGTFLTRNDDASSLTLDARITAPLDAACYILLATSSFADEFGEYQITLEEPPTSASRNGDVQ